MHWQRFGRSLFAVLAWCCWHVPASLHANDKMTLHLVYTSDTIGYVDPCG
jgi:hypothetical protein